MNAILAGFFGGWEVVVILGAVLLLFGSKKLPELAKGLGQGIKEFKKATREVTEEVHNAMDETPVPPQRRLPANTVASVEPEHPLPQASAGPKA